jgi:hypothetical protein
LLNCTAPVCTHALSSLRHAVDICAQSFKHSPITHCYATLQCQALAPAFGDTTAVDDAAGYTNGYNSSNGQQQEQQQEHNTLIHRLLRALKAVWEPTWQVDVPQGRVTAAADRAAEAAIQRVLATTAAAASSNGTAAARCLLHCYYYYCYCLHCLL